MNKPKFVSYDEIVIDELRNDRKFALLYLRETCCDEDSRHMLFAIRDVSLAYIEEIAASKLTTQLKQSINCYYEFTFIHSVCHQLKLHLHVTHEKTRQMEPRNVAQKSC